ncbi:MAG: L-rhamnose/proton symporter RhaT [Acidobacteriaceae bacterium]
MEGVVAFGALLALLSGAMNGLFTMPMRFLGRWSWENVWSVFIVGACLLLPVVIVTGAPGSWAVLAHAPTHAVTIALATGFAWGFGAVMFGQSVSAIGIALANTFVLAISSALGSLIPMLLLTPGKIHERAGVMILTGIAVEIVGIVLCGRAGMLREGNGRDDAAQRGDLVGKARPLAVALILVLGSGLLSAVFNVGFALAHPISEYGQQQGLSEFASTNLIWILMLGGGAVSNLGFCGYLLLKNGSAHEFVQPGGARLYGFGLLMALLWGGSIFVYGAAAPRLGALGASIGWPLSLATGLLVANVVGLALGEWKGAPRGALVWMVSGIGVLILAILILSKAN